MVRHTPVISVMAPAIHLGVWSMLFELCIIASGAVKA